MHKAKLLIGLLLFIISSSSCTPEATIEQSPTKNCCGDEGNLPPPPFVGGN